MNQVKLKTTNNYHTKKKKKVNDFLTLPELLSGTLKEAMALVDGRISVNVTVVKICHSKNQIRSEKKHVAKG